MNQRRASLGLSDPYRYGGPQCVPAVHLETAATAVGTEHHFGDLHQPQQSRQRLVGPVTSYPPSPGSPVSTASGVCCTCFCWLCECEKPLGRRNSSAHHGSRSSSRESDRGVLVIVVGLMLFSLVYYFSRTHTHNIVQRDDIDYTYVCNPGLLTCQIQALSNDSAALPEGINRCAMNCAPTVGLWPMPRGSANLSSEAYNFLPGDVSVMFQDPLSLETRLISEEIKTLFMDSLLQIHPEYDPNSRENPFPGYKSGFRIVIDINFVDLKSEEAYEMKIHREEETLANGKLLRVVIYSRGLSGSRHALRTFLQLVTYDEMTSSLQVTDQGYIEDSPKYDWRGLALTADDVVGAMGIRALKQLVDSLAEAKMNRLRLKLSRAQSARLAFESEVAPELCKGVQLSGLVYEGRLTLSKSELKDLVSFGALRGVLVWPEIEVPFVDGLGQCIYEESEDFHIKEAQILREINLLFQTTFLHVSVKSELLSKCNEPFDESTLLSFRKNTEDFTIVCSLDSGQDFFNATKNKIQIAQRSLEKHSESETENARYLSAIALDFESESSWRRMLTYDPHEQLSVSANFSDLLGAEVEVSKLPGSSASAINFAQLSTHLAAAAEALWTGNTRTESWSLTNARLSVFGSRLSHSNKHYQ